MAKRPRWVPGHAAMKVGPVTFAFDRSVPAERACASYVLDAPLGGRTDRLRRLILLGHATLSNGRPADPPSVTED